MAYSFSKDWMDEIAEVSTRSEFQNCTIAVVDPDEVWYPGPNYPGDPDDLTKDGYDWRTDTYLEPVTNGEVYSGQARFIPIRAGIHHGGEAQANATTIRYVRFQIPKDGGPAYIRKGLTVKFLTAPKNPSLVGRWATSTDDFQGSSSAARTFTAAMDIDSGGPLED